MEGGVGQANTKCLRINDAMSDGVLLSVSQRETEAGTVSASDQPSKPGMSRRKGDEYQDLWALRLALERYIKREDFEMYLEYENAQSLDDIVIVQEKAVAGYQVKCSVQANQVYEAGDFTIPDRPVYLGKLANGWNRLRAKYRNYAVTSHLLTNRALEGNLRRILDGECLPPDFCSGNVRSWRKELRESLGRATELEARELPGFLESLRFHHSQPDLAELKRHIKDVLLDYKLGISDLSVYLKLKRLTEQHAIHLRTPITKGAIATVIEEHARERRLPQKFSVDSKTFIRLNSFFASLTDAIRRTDGGYVVVTGPPGSGKSTSLSEFLKVLSETDQYETVPYYCFVDLNDYHQQRRLEGETLVANLLARLQEQFPDALTRRFDYSPEHFVESLSTLGKAMLAAKKRLIILVDGLDHVERTDTTLHRSVMDALPKVVPKGITFVLGTRELQRWPTFLQDRRKGGPPHLAIPLFGVAEVHDYLVTKCELKLSATQVKTAHKISEGLPLYLYYTTKRLKEAGSIDEELARLPSALGGDVDYYYREIWQQYEHHGTGEARHLCLMLAALRFAVSQDELQKLQGTLSEPAFADAFRAVKHLLRDRLGRLAVFHSSFREFVFSQLRGGERQTAYVGIHNWLKTQDGTSLWYSQAFWYAYAAKDYEFLKRTVGLGFIDKAVSDLCPERHLLAAIDFAADAAKETEDLVALAKLGALKHRTSERWSQNIDRRLLTRALSRLGRTKDILRLIYDDRADELLQDTGDTLAMLAELARGSPCEDSATVFWKWLDYHPGSRPKEREDVTNFAACIGAFGNDVRRGLTWAARANLRRNEMETEEPWAPGYVPVVDAYLKALPDKLLVEAERPIADEESRQDRQVLQYSLLKEVTRRGQQSTLNALLHRYIRDFKPTGDPLLAFIGAVAGLRAKDVMKILGPVAVPDKSPTGFLPTSDSSLVRYRLQFTALSYAGQHEALKDAEVRLLANPSWYNGYCRYLLRVGKYVGMYLTGRTGSPDDALEGLDILAGLRPERTKHLPELTMICRRELDDSLFWFAKAMVHGHPSRLPEFFQKLRALRTTAFWTQHWGFGEHSEDYSFELDVNQRLASIPECRQHVQALLDECAISYSNNLYLEGSTRAEHFLLLAGIAAQCGFGNAARGWLEDGLQHSLQYGSHKDVTLYFLIDVVRMLNKRDPSKALARCAEIMRMVDWMPFVTDNRETKGLAAEIYGHIAEMDRAAGLKVLREYRETKGRWQVLNCLEKLLRNPDGMNPDVLWALALSFTNEGEGPQQQVNAMSAAVRGAEEQGKAVTAERLKERLVHFIGTCVDPAIWPKLQCSYWTPPAADSRLSSGEVDEDATTMRHESYVLDGKTVSTKDVEARLRKSIGEYLSTRKKLQEENTNIYSLYQWEHILQEHISSATRRADLVPAEEYLDPKERYLDTRLSLALGMKLLEFGELDRGCVYLAKAYQYELDWWYWHWQRDTVETVARYDRRRAKTMAVLECHRRIRESGGYTVTPLAAAAADVLGESENLKTIYADFRDYCQELFRSLPPKNSYNWMATYDVGQDDLNRLAVEYLADELNEPEIDLGLRLIDACRDLCLALPEVALPVFMERVHLAPMLAKSRLTSVLWLVACQRPDLMLPHTDSLAHLADEQHFQRKMLAAGILKLVQKASALPDKVASRLASIESDYSPQRSCRTFRVLAASPTPEFHEFYVRYVLGSIRIQIETSCRVLDTDLDSALAKVESNLHRAGWNVETARERTREDWKSYVHPQGWPVVWPMKSCDLEIWDAFNHVLGEIALNSPLPGSELEGLWRVLHPGDPEWKWSATVPRPADIVPLEATDKEAWLAELPPSTKTLARSALESEWFTAYEQRVLSRVLGNEARLRSWLHTSSTLVAAGTEPTGEHIEHACDRPLVMRVADRNEAMTLRQARSFLSAEYQDPPREFLPFMPLVAAKQNSPHYPGFSRIYSLCGYLIRRCNLKFSGLNLLDGATTVVRYENWQEGYEKEAYSRELLSYGTRLLVHRSLLQRILEDLRVTPCQTEHEERFYYASPFKREPAVQKSRTLHRILTLG